jgi:hypothetical protein
MLNSVSWGQYITFLSVSAVIYYVCIAYLYFKKELLALVGITVVTDASKSSHSIIFPKDVSDKSQSNQFNALKDELEAFISSLNNSSVKAETLNGLGYLLTKYPSKLISENKSVLQ